MVIAVDDKASHLVRDTQKSVLEARSNKVGKRSKDKKPLKGVQFDAVVEAVGDNSAESDTFSDSKEKKPQGIVIDGKTYTCATCKTGHRVGVCKHARNRPMTATHPPGRPQAGAPKKVVCDCPKQCSCKKKDCKCARACSCTQTMFMLVYVPAPGEEDTSGDDKGSWKLGERVTTDLKGNVLTAKQIEERQNLKEAMKTQPRENHIGHVTAEAQTVSKVGTSSNAQARPTADRGCCTHKETLSARSIPTEMSPQLGGFPKPPNCNCGSHCTCAFCPEHPNNNTSRSSVRHAIHYRGSLPQHNYQSITPFMPMLAPEASCMGGAPQFAISNSDTMPSQYDLQQTFPSRGYVIGYPFQYRLSDNTALPGFPYHMAPQYQPEMSIVNPNGLLGMQTPMPTPHPDVPLRFDCSQDDIDIGNAHVASAGNGEWNADLLISGEWPLEASTSGSAVFSSYSGTPSFSRQSFTYSEAPITPMLNEGSDFENNLGVRHEDFFLDMAANPLEKSKADTKPYAPLPKTCCGVGSESHTVPTYHGPVETYHGPVKENFFDMSYG